MIRKKVLVGLEGRETDGHLWYDPTQDGSQSFVKCQGRLSPHDLNACSDKPAWFRLGMCKSLI